MRLVLALIIVAACSDPAEMPDAGVDAGDPSSIEPRPCTDFQQMVSCNDAICNHDAVFIAPLAGTVVVAGDDFVAFEGSSYPQTDGTTSVLRALEYHFANGATQAGSYGARGHLPAFDEQCEWTAAIRVE